MAILASRVKIPGVHKVTELLELGTIIQFGRPPHRIDLMNAIDGVSFPTAWRSRVRVRLEGAETPIFAFYIGLRPLAANKKASGRPKDIQDLEYLRRKLSHKKPRSSAMND